jgi:predicted urease superfamily metal-dependent hydrolase
MRWLKPNLRSSIYGLLGNPVAPSESMLETGTEDIRESMLVVLGEAGPKHFPQVTRRIRYANDIQALWYLRGDLMAALAAMHGEATAREKISSLTRMFQGLLPNGLTSRPSPLVG